MAAKKSSKKKVSVSTQQKVGVGIGLTAAAVAAAGAYFLYGSEDAKKNRRKVKSWMFKAKAEVLETLEKADEMSEKEYNKLIDSVSGAYGRLKDASKADIATFKREMKEHWGEIEAVGKPLSSALAGAMAGKKAGTKAAKKTAKKTAKKKATKKTTKKTARKSTKSKK